MNFLLKLTPAPYAILLFIFTVFGFAAAIFLDGPHAAFLRTSEVLATLYMWLSLGLGALYIIAFVIQVAVLDLHQDKAYAYEESKVRLVRLLLTLFMLALPPVAVMGISLRYQAQVSWGHSLMSEGSIVYIVCALFIAMFFLMWGSLIAIQNRVHESPHIA